MNQIDFYYDIVSPYSFIAFEFLQKKQNAWNLEINLCPFFLGGVMKATGNSAPFFLAARAPYLLKDIQRQAQFHNLPMVIPTDFPGHSISAQRFLTAAKVDDPGYLPNLSHEFWLRHYGEGKPINQPQDIQICGQKAGISTSQIERWIEQTQDELIKNKLKATTQEALDRGAFGAPTFFVKKDGTKDWDMFFGSDRMHLVEELLLTHNHSRGTNQAVV